MAAMRTWMFVIAYMVFGPLAAPSDAGAAEVSLGVNAPMGSLTVEQQNTNLANLHATARWVAFRDKTLLPLLVAEPDDPHLPNFLKQAEAILAWRTTVPEEDRFWKVDANS